MATGQIFIYGYIGQNTGEVSVKNIQAQINKSFDNYVVHIISGGGDVFEGFGIYNLIRNTGKPVVVQIEGICASIATLAAATGFKKGDSRYKIIMNKTGQFMVHNPFVSDLKGDSRVLINAAGQLDKIKDVLVNVYEDKTGLPKAELDKLYDNETWLSPQEALSMGFVDEVVDAIKAVATINPNYMKESPFTKLLNWIRPKIKNQMTATLEDGRAIVIMADGEDPTGAQVVLETGEPLPAGDYKLTTGEVLTLDDTSIITAFQPPAAPGNTTEDMKAQEEIAALKAKIAELEGASATAKQTAEQAQAAEAQAKATAATISNRVDLMEKELKDIKAAYLLTIGDTTQPDKKGPQNKGPENQIVDPMLDAMAELGESYITSRPSSSFKRKN